MAKRLLQLVAFSIAVFMIGGCITHYKEPTSGPRAKVRFAMFGGLGLSGSTRVIGYDGTPCKNRTLITQLGVSDTNPFFKNHKSLGIPLNPAAPIGKSAFTEVHLPAGHRYSVSMDWFDPGYYVMKGCDLTTSFVPRDGSMYEVLDVLTKDKCGIAVFDIVKGKTGKFEARRDASQRRERTCDK